MLNSAIKDHNELDKAKIYLNLTNTVFNLKLNEEESTTISKVFVERKICENNLLFNLNFKINGLLT